MTDHRVRHDRLTIFTYIGLMAYVWGMYALGPSLLLLRAEQGTSRTVASLHSTALTMGVMTIGFVGARVTGRLGRTNTVRLGHVLAVVGLLLVIFGPHPLVSIPGGFFMGVGGSLMTNAQNAFLTLHHGRAGAAAISESNAFAAFAAMIAPLLVGGLVALEWSWRWGLAAAIVLFALSWAFYRDGDALEIRGPEHHDIGTRLPRAYWWAWGTLAMCIGTEFSFMLWSGDLLRDRGGFSVAAAAAGLAAVTGGMTIARAGTPALLRRFDAEAIYRASIVVPLLVWLPLWLTSNGVLMLVAMFVMGCGMGFHFPMSIARMLKAAPGMEDLAAGRSSIAAGVAGGVLPFLLGAVADTFSMHTAFALIPVMLGLALVMAVRHPVH